MEEEKSDVLEEISTYLSGIDDSLEDMAKSLRKLSQRPEPVEEDEESAE